MFLDTGPKTDIGCELTENGRWMDFHPVILDLGFQPSRVRRPGPESLREPSSSSTVVQSELRKRPGRTRNLGVPGHECPDRGSICSPVSGRTPKKGLDRLWIKGISSLGPTETGRVGEDLSLPVRCDP